jgi:hypothetical protein
MAPPPPPESNDRAFPDDSRNRKTSIEHMLKQAGPLAFRDRITVDRLKIASCDVCMAPGKEPSDGSSLYCLGLLLV